MDSFTRAYIEAALWSSNDDQDISLDKNYTTGDLAPEALARMEADCARFQRENAAPEYGHAEYSDTELAGHDFWLTRNRHGSGFWDWPALSDLRQVLTDAAHAYGECNLYVGDDGLIYLA